MGVDPLRVARLVVQRLEGTVSSELVVSEQERQLSKLFETLIIATASSQSTDYSEEWSLDVDDVELNDSDLNDDDDDNDSGDDWDTEYRDEPEKKVVKFICSPVGSMCTNPHF